MSERISIAELRERADALYYSPANPVTRHHVLALVEAVEAAHDYCETPATTTMEAAKWAYERLDAVLARFDFGDA